jgi:hypothetical protein
MMVVANITSFQWVLLIEVGIIAAVLLLGAVHRP